MSINRSMYIGLTGMAANSTAINTIGDNIANMNTVGFKAGRTLFQEMLGASLMGGGSMGGGVGVADVEKMFQQGALVGTGVTTDMAIAGEGFFALQGQMNGVDGNFYSRAGQFHRDEQGFLVNPQGLQLLGYAADAKGNVSSAVSALQIDDSPMPPSATSQANISVNLNPSHEALTNDDGSDKVWDPANPGATSEFSTSMSVYDSQGRPHELNVFYDKGTDGSWTAHFMMDNKNIDGTTGFTELGDPAGTALTFKDGALTNAPATFDLSFTPQGSDAQSITLDIGGTTNYEAKSAQINQSHNGLQSGTFQTLNIDADGQVMGTFSNGEQRILGNVAVARFKSPDGLNSLGAGLFAGSIDSGSVIMGSANAGGRGQLVSGSLEQSTVDLATEFTNMIVAQRGYQANSRTITTADQMMQEAMNIKR